MNVYSLELYFSGIFKYFIWNIKQWDDDIASINDNYCSKASCRLKGKAW